MNNNNIEKSNNNYINRAHLTGRVITNPKEVVRHDQVTFYQFMLAVCRDSDIADEVPIMLSEEKAKKITLGDHIKITGTFRSYNHIYGQEGDKIQSHLHIYVLAKDLQIVDDTDEYENEIEILGFLINRKPLRVTPESKREIVDMTLAVNNRNKSYYAPCIAWSKTAHYCEGLEIGSQMHIKARFQSRNYDKVIDGVKETRTAYELSICRIEDFNNR